MKKERKKAENGPEKDKISRLATYVQPTTDITNEVEASHDISSWCNCMPTQRALHQLASQGARRKERSLSSSFGADWIDCAMNDQQLIDAWCEASKAPAW
jgi:hypothetical protein